MRANDQPDDLRIDPKWGLEGEPEAALRDEIWRYLMLGQLDAEEFAAEYVEHSKGPLPLSEADLGEVFAELAAARARQQSGWGKDRFPIEVGFDALGEIGVLARANFTCCGTCGAAEIGDERDDSRVWRGYVFFHTQDAANIAHDATTYLSYGIFLDAYIEEAAWEGLSDEERDRFYWDTTAALVAEEIIPTLERSGLKVSWNGDTGTRILLTDIDYAIPV